MKTFKDMSKYFYHRNSLKYIVLLLLISTTTDANAQRKRVRDLGIDIGIFQTGKWNAITDVSGVEVGHKTLIRSDHIRTGVTLSLIHI